MNPKIVFFGTPEFALPALESLIKSDFDIVAVVTQPDKPKGRNKKALSPPPVKELALEHSITVLQPAKLSDPDFLTSLQSLHSNESPIDVFVIVAYGKIIPQTILDIPKHGSINIHPSLLPLHRGPSPLQAQILSGDPQAGVSIMLIDEEMDHGPLLWQEPHIMNGSETYESLGNILFNRASEQLPKVINEYLQKEIDPQIQDHDKAMFCKLIKKEEGLIDWSQPAEHIERMVRAYNPWPSAFSPLPYKEGVRGRSPHSTYKILNASISNKSTDLSPGDLFTENNTLFAAAGNNSVLEIHTIQPSGKKPMSGEDFARGYLG